MAEMDSLWGFAENGDMDQLGQKLLYATLELEKLKSEAMEEMRKNKEYVNQLIHLLRSAIEERDEARNNLQNLITTAAAIHSPTAATTAEIFPAMKNPHLKPAKMNSSITESNSLSETHNYHSHSGSSPVAADSIFDAATSSPDFPSMNLSTSPFQINGKFSSFSSMPIMMPKLDRGSMIIENLVKGRVLPQKGMLLETVLQAGPLLQTLMVAGPLPRWRNPPQMQAFQMPPVAIKGGGNIAEVLDQKPALRQLSSSSNSYNVVPTMPDFGKGYCGSKFVNNASLISSAVSSNGCLRLPKRQRFY